MTLNQKYFMPQGGGAAYTPPTFKTGGINTGVIGGGNQQGGPMATTGPRTMGTGSNPGFTPSGGAGGGYSSYGGGPLNTGQQQAAGNEGNWGNTYLGSYYNNPLKTMFGPGGAGLPGLANQWGISGYGGVNPDDPRISQWMANLSGGQNAMLDQYSRQMANAGVAASRGGQGVQGGMDPYAAMRGQQMGTLAGQYGANYKQAVDWTKQGNDANASLLNSLLGAYGNMYSTDVNAGVNLLGLQNSALQANAGNALQYAQMGQNAWDKDVAYKNQQADANRLRSQQKSDQWEQEQKQQGMMNKWQQAAAQQGQPKPDPNAQRLSDLQYQTLLEQYKQAQLQGQMANKTQTIQGDAYNKALQDYTRGDMTWGQGTWFPTNAKTFMDVGLMNKLGGGAQAMGQSSRQYPGGMAVSPNQFVNLGNGKTAW